MSPPTSPTLSPPRPASVSSNSSNPSRDQPQQFFVKTPSGQTTTLTIPHNTSIATVKSLVALQVPFAIPSSETRLTYAGRTLDSPEKLLSEYQVPPTATLELILPSPRSTPEQVADIAGTSIVLPGANAQADPNAPLEKALEGDASSSATPSAAKAKPSGGARKKGPRCGASGCGAPAQRIVGDCGFCGGHYCGKHRLLESHQCDGLEEARNQDKDRNREKLEGERTVSGRLLV